MSTPVHSPDVDHLAFGDEVLVFDGELLQRLVGSAAAIWGRIDGVRSSERIIRDLAKDFGSAAELAKDVPAFLAELERAGLIHLEPTQLGRLSVPTTVAWVRDRERVVLADLNARTRTALSDTATLVWELADTGLTSEEVVADLASVFPDAPASLAADVTAALEELVAQGWLRAG